MDARFEIGFHASRYIEGFIAFFAHVRFGGRTFYAQRTRTSAYDRPSSYAHPRLIVWRGRQAGVDVGTYSFKRTT